MSKCFEFYEGIHMDSKHRITLIEERLNKALTPIHLNIIDDSAEHAHHPEAQASGGGHFTIEITSSHFKHKTSIEQHKLIYDALSDLMNTEIHALSIKVIEEKEDK